MIRLNTNINQHATHKPIILIMIIVLLCLNHSNAIAQKSCLQSLEKAEMLYTEGKLNLIPDLLTNCIKKGFDYEQKVRAYELVILSYLYLDNEKDAANSMLDLLKFEKEYTLTGREPTEFKKLYEAFRTYPIVMIGINLGGNASLITHNELYGVNNPSPDSRVHQFQCFDLECDVLSIERK